MLADVVARWSGEIIRPTDGIASIGRDPSSDHVFIATGGGGGVTHGMIAGLLITDLACGRENAWQQLYDPSRKRLHALADSNIPKDE
jgi:glycine/D-amino acid oxidase-like deaminating enzyme